MWVSETVNYHNMIKVIIIEYQSGILMNQKTLTIIIVAVLAIAVVAVAAYFLMGTEDNVEDPVDIITVENATSLKFSVEETIGEDIQATYIYSAKNLRTTNLMIRLEIPGEYDLIEIINGVNQTAWESIAGEWTDLTDTFSDQSGMWSVAMEGYTDKLTTWTEGDWTYEVDGTTVRIYDIAIDPVLADSLFAP